MKKSVMKTILAVLMVMSLASMPVCAADTAMIQPYFNNVSSAQLTIAFDMNNVVYCNLSLTPYSHGSGVSGVMKLYDSSNTCLAVWPISDYERPLVIENTYQGVYGETYTATFEGYAYSNNQTAADRLELSVTDTCVDYD